MGGFTLDQLLDETGVGDLAKSRSSTKTASAEESTFAKLAERCLRAASSTEPAATSSAAERELAEKTAAVAIIGRTLAEIREIEGSEPGTQKTAAPVTSPGVEVFIKEALAAGHSPQAIAEFLEKQAGLLDRAKGAFREMRAGHALGRAERLGAKAEAKGGEAFRRFQDHLRKGEALGEAERDKIVSNLRVRLGDDKAAQLVAEHPAYKNLPAAKGLKKAAPPAPAAAHGAAEAVKKPAEGGGLSIGGMSISGDQLNKLKKPAALVGAGYLGHRALTSGQDEKKKSGVVVVNS